MGSDITPNGARPSGLSLYANLVDTSTNEHSAPGTISRAPVAFKDFAGEDGQQDRASTGKQQISAASLRFLPPRRPHLSTQKPKSKASAQKPSVIALSTAPTPPDPAGPTLRLPAKPTLADWTASGGDDDINGFYGGEKRQRGGRKKRKKTKENSQLTQNWDDIYDPSRPNSYEDYKHSEEKIMEIREWKDKLYTHRLGNKGCSDSDSSDDNYRSQLNKQFAPPTVFDDHEKLEGDIHEANVPDDPTGEDAYARRTRLPGLRNPAAVPGPPPVLGHTNKSLSPPPPPSAPELFEARRPSPPLAANAPLSISKAPVRYNLPSAPSDIPASEARLESALETGPFERDVPSGDVTRSLRPGQKGFAERLMSKYGWSKGSGLGASGSGIVNPLRVQVEKQKKKPDSEGGGFAGPGGRGKIIGGGRKGAEPQEGKFGPMSEVIILQGMVDGMDLDLEVEGSGDGGLMQEIGEECGDKYGRVERVVIDRSHGSKASVFVKFTSQLSALKAVNALDGRIFNGNTITARYFNTDKFESGVYE